MIISRYSSVLKENGLFTLDRWLDVRGNHDSFFHYPNEHPYKTHTVYGASNMSSIYSRIFHTDSGPLRFVGIDANEPLLRHFNGFLSQSLLDSLEELFLSSESITLTSF